MTRNEILYQQNLETNRSNLAREQETGRANRAAEAENERSHRASEFETHRANLARETEANRSNVVKESQAWAQLNEQHRSATVKEAETERANRAQESLGWGRLSEERIKNRNQELLKGRELAYTQDYRDSQLAEQERSNKAREEQATYDTEVSKFLSLYQTASKELMAKLDRESREKIAAALNEVTKRGQDLKLIGEGLDILRDLLNASGM